VTFNVTARVNQSDFASIVSGALPQGASLFPEVCPVPSYEAAPDTRTQRSCLEGSQSQTCTRTFRWTPSFGQQSTSVCFVASGTRCSTIGNYCVRLSLCDPSAPNSICRIIYVTGVRPQSARRRRRAQALTVTW
jgi:hypothetical protein